MEEKRRYESFGRRAQDAERSVLYHRVEQNEIAVKSLKKALTTIIAGVVGVVQIAIEVIRSCMI
tara:strand:- start:1011 stop:1202 length:192 start_codon:yes stop_codon:yes gene_type:complete